MYDRTRGRKENGKVDTDYYCNSTGFSRISNDQGAEGCVDTCLHIA